VTFVGTKLHIADTKNNRILVFNSTPTTNHAAADFIIGQVNQTVAMPNSQSSISSTMVNATRVYADSNRLIVADPYRHRVLIWNSFPTGNNQTPDVVLGQANFTSGAANRDGAASCSTLSYPKGVYYDGTKLYVADSGNNRVLVWNSLPSSNGVAADVVLGQSSCSAVSVGSGTSQMWDPVGVGVANQKLFVSDKSNNRILAFNTTALSSGQNATFVLKWTATTGCPTTSSLALSRPEQVFSDGSKLLIPDTDNHRIVAYNSIPTAAACPDYVLGQNNGGSQSTSVSPFYTGNIGGGAFDASGNLFITNTDALRIEKFLSGNIPTTTGLFQTADGFWGAFNSTTTGGFSAYSTLGGYGFMDVKTPAIVGNQLVVPDGFGRISIVPKP
jgi:hypothetical protein